MKITANKIISIIAHDLKDPLTSISGITDILKDNWFDFADEEKLDILNDIRETTDSTLKLLSDLLEWSKKVNEISEPERKLFNAGREIAAILGPVNHKARWKKIIIENQAPTDIILKADVNMFSAVFRNLMANAIKSCPDGGKIIIRAENSGDFWRFCIADNGIGMTKQQIDSLFSKNGFCCGTPGASGYSNGFGLILCKDFVEIQGGELWAESEEGKGTRVCFTFPGKW